MNKSFFLSFTCLIFALAMVVTGQNPQASAQDKTDNPKDNAGNFTVISPGFLTEYVEQTCNKLEQDNKKFHCSITKSSPWTAFSLFEQGKADLAIGFNPFPYHGPDSKINILKNSSGTDILAVEIGRAGLLLLVNPSNPLKGLTLFQTDAIFSSTIRCGYPFAITKWGFLGLSGSWQEQSIHITGLARKSFEAKFFQKLAMCNGSLKEEFEPQIDTADVVKKIQADKKAIGFANFLPVTEGVKPLPLAAREGSAYFPPDTENILSGQYPLARAMYLFVNLPKNHQLRPWQKL
ncbi:MAG: hypothetical protein DSZ23_00830, partial [Thermodesulfatator sp.]